MTSIINFVIRYRPEFFHSLKLVFAALSVDNRTEISTDIGHPSSGRTISSPTAVGWMSVSARVVEKVSPS